MIEVIYNENAEEKKSKTTVRLPKNIRQIGITDDKFKVYVEDYVVTFLNQMTHKDLSKIRVAILMGELAVSDSRYLFISGAIYVEEMIVDGEGIHFTDSVWNNIYENVKEYFDTLEIVGWYLSVPGFPIEMNADIVKVHINQFAGNGKVLLMKEPIEGEERFFYYENGTMQELGGYYIYYERNNSMQTYMIDHRDKSEQEEELRREEAKVNVATRQFRSIVQEKQEEIHKRKMTSFMYTVSSVLVMIVLIIGITMMNNYDKMNNIEKSVAILTKNSIQKDIENDISENSKEEILPASAEKTVTIAVETVSGNVEKIPTEDENSGNSQQKEETNTENNQQQSTKEGDNAEQQQETQNQQELDNTNQENSSKNPVQEGSEQQSQETSKNQTSQQEQASREEDSNNEQPDPTEEPAQEQEQPAAETVAEPNYYVIQEGDTLAEISLRVYHTKKMVNKICEANGIEDVDKIFVGQKILLP
ncbi:MAG: LysM peptidoglycan-binding domain-containing protein [Lachnospiraceae bacterium]|nr:LysM peptidoglycan-binding domain-containing protein [Lachnospiraceae bacterium]